MHLSRKEAVVLELLAGDPGAYALDLVKQSMGRLVRGTVYVTLSRLEQKGYVRSKEEPPPPGWPG